MGVGMKQVVVVGMIVSSLMIAACQSEVGDVAEGIYNLFLMDESLQKNTILKTLTRSSSSDTPSSSGTGKKVQFAPSMVHSPSQENGLKSSVSKENLNSVDPQRLADQYRKKRADLENSISEQRALLKLNLSAIEGIQEDLFKKLYCYCDTEIKTISKGLALVAELKKLESSENVALLEDHYKDRFRGIGLIMIRLHIETKRLLTAIVTGDYLDESRYNKFSIDYNLNETVSGVTDESNCGDSSV